jgi:hypothetical protein
MTNKTKKDTGPNQGSKSKAARGESSGPVSDLPKDETARWIATVADLTRERDESNKRLKILNECLDDWQTRFCVLSDAWRNGNNNNDVLSAVERFVKAKDGDLTTKKLEELESLRAQNAKLREALDNIQWTDVHGCISGDCPHDDVNDCVKALTEWCEETGKIARAALGEGEG